MKKNKYKRIKFLILDKLDNFFNNFRVRIGKELLDMYMEDEKELIYSDFYECSFKRSDFE